MERNCKRIFVGLDYLVIWIISLAIIIFSNMLGAVEFSKGSLNAGVTVALIVIDICVFVFFELFTLLCNRACNVVQLRDGILRRRGLFFGFRKEVSVSAIKRIDKIFYPLDGAYYVLVDDDSCLVERFRKKSAICIPCSEGGVEFIKLFWDGLVPPWYTDAHCP